MRHNSTRDAPAPRRRVRHLRRRIWQVPAVITLGAVASVVPITHASVSHAASGQTEGLACATGSTAPGGSLTLATPGTTPSFVLTAHDGYILTPDGNSLYTWGYSNGNDGFQYPGPVLCVHEGDTVTVTLRNTLPATTSLMFPGIEDVSADGSISVPDPATGSLSKPAPANSTATPNHGAQGGQVTYRFVAAHPGTFLYESATNPALQVQMGLAGAIVVRPKPYVDGSGKVYDETKVGHVYDDPSGLGTFSTFDAKHEYLHVLSEIDPALHEAIESGASSYDLTKYKARYFFINGRAFPDTIAPNNAAHLPAQPYGALVHLQPRNTDTASVDYNPYSAMIRYLNIGPVDYPFHPHSNQERQIGVDGHELVNANGGPNGTPGDDSIDRFGIAVAPGQTTETTFSWVDAQKWDPATNPIGVIIPDQQARTEGAYWSGSPYLGNKQDLATGVTQYNQCGEMYQVAHSHALFEATNYGTSMGGMLTMIRIDPPNSVQAKQNACSQG